MTDEPKKTEIKKEHVEEAVADLKARGLMEDTGWDLPNGGRSPQRWLATMKEDMGIIQLKLEESLRGFSDPEICLAVALKEAQRLESDIYRFASESHGISRQRLEHTRRGL